MNRDDIRHGIMLFQYSNTAQHSGRARTLIQVLWNLYRSNEIGFHLDIMESIRTRAD